MYTPLNSNVLLGHQGRLSMLLFASFGKLQFQESGKPEEAVQRRTVSAQRIRGKDDHIIDPSWDQQSLLNCLPQTRILPQQISVIVPRNNDSLQFRSTLNQQPKNSTLKSFVSCVLLSWFVCPHTYRRSKLLFCRLLP